MKNGLLIAGAVILLLLLAAGLALIVRRLINRSAEKREIGRASCRERV